MALPHPLQRRIKAPGLRWIKRNSGFTPFWIPPERDLKAGYRPKTVNLSRLADDPVKIAERCDELQCEVLEWRSARTFDPLGFNGTIRSLAIAYQSHQQSPYQELRPSSSDVYLHYMKRIVREIGDRTVDDISGIDLKRWHAEWSRGGQCLAASKMCRAVLQSMVSFGVEARLKGCAELSVALKASNRKLPNPRRREFTVTADDVVRLRKAAHADGRPSSALVYAMVFETTLRLWDVIGQWWRIKTTGKQKWFGIQWEDIGPDLVLRYVPSKTSAKTGLAVTYPLDRAPMVMEELAHWPVEKRTGPVIVYEGTGRPFESSHFGEKWRLDRAKAGVSDKIWARDLRASGITEAMSGEGRIEDAAKVAGHASTKTTAAVYDRANLEAAERFADARTAKRKLTSVGAPPAGST